MDDDGAAPGLEFPCDFPIKAMGEAEPDFVLHVVEIVRRHVPDLDETRITTRASRKGRYVSVTVTITARSRAQLDALYTALSGDPRISVVL
jgi:putative lipoic acid-binding regulatory protein